MPNANHKQQVLGTILGKLKKDLDVEEPTGRPVLEQLLYAVCREGTTRTHADKAFRSLQSTFFDWNEVRVSAPREVEEALGGLPDAYTRAERLIALLQNIFETTYSFDLESLHKKGLQQAEKQLHRFLGSTPFAVKSTLQLALDGHALPIDEPMQRTLRRLQLIDDRANGDGSLEHLVPKARGALFCEVVGELAFEYCHEESPACPRCPINDQCPTGQKNLKPARSSGKSSRATTKTRTAR